MGFFGFGWLFFVGFFLSLNSLSDLIFPLHLTQNAEGVNKITFRWQNQNCHRTLHFVLDYLLHFLFSSFISCLTSTW